MATAVATLTVASSCTGGDPVADDGPATDGAGATPIVVPVVASVTGPASEGDGAVLDGARLAQGMVRRAGGIDGRPLRLRVIDDGGDPAATRRLLRDVVAEEPPAVMAAEPGFAVGSLRSHIERRRVPVLLLRGDLYTSRRLYRQVFQAAPPVRWQAAVLAPYLAGDRGAGRVVVVVEERWPGPGAGAALEAALAEEGAHPAAVLRLGPGGRLGPVRAAARRADAVVFAGSAREGGRLSRALSRLPDPPRLALTAEGLERPAAAEGGLRPGTVAVGTYAWAGWADPIARVARFRSRFERRYDRLPGGFEQQGFEAVMALAAGLTRSHGRGGEALSRALERLPSVTFSELPVDLGPDDHLMADRHLLGLFAVSGPREDVERWAPPWARWRPLMRTFTLLGDRTSILDRDKRTFFPGWRRRKPAPFYWRARYGIATRPEEDPLH